MYKSSLIKMRNRVVVNTINTTPSHTNTSLSKLLKLLLINNMMSYLVIQKAFLGFFEVNRRPPRKNGLTLKTIETIE